jgi:hypothetical protein
MPARSSDEPDGRHQARRPSPLRRQGAGPQSRRRRPVTPRLLTALALTAGSAAAQTTGERCAPAETLRPFEPWLDPVHYVLAPGGNLETDRASWTLDREAAIVAGNEPFHVGSPNDDASLRLPGGSSATTAPICIGVEHPTLRLFAQRSAGSVLSPLLVEALFTDAAGYDHALPIGTIYSLGGWAPSAPLAIGVNLLADSEQTLSVSFRFTPSDNSQWFIDDVYVDPFRTN